MHPIIRCSNCKHWKETKPEVKIGDCKILGIQTEACSGIRLMVRNKIWPCPHFSHVEGLKVENICHKTGFILKTS